MALLTLIALVVFIGTLVVAVFPGRMGVFLQGLTTRWWQFSVGLVCGVVAITVVGGWSPFLLMVIFMLCGAFGAVLAMWALRTTTLGRRLAAILLVPPPPRTRSGSQDP